MHRFLLRHSLLPILISAAVLRAGAAESNSPVATSSSPDTMPWLTTLSLTGREYYDDNVLVVSGLGLPEQSSWVNDIVFDGGVNFAPLLNQGPALSVLSLAYELERADYHDVPSENYTAHRPTLQVQGKQGPVSYSLTNAFMFIDGNKLAETYALNQLAGTSANQDDKYRNNFTHAVARERRNQDQDRYTAQLRWDDPRKRFFVRGASNLIYYHLNTDLFNTSKAPYLGYQDYVSRWDLNAGADLGFNVTPTWAFTIGYRDGYQHQDQFALAINSDQHFASNYYQRLLFGAEGSPLPWLQFKFQGGPDFRNYNADTPISHDRTTRYYGEGTATATLASNQTLSLSYKQWFWVSSTGLVPYEDTIAGLTYHLGLLTRLGLDAGVKYLDANYTLGNDDAGSAPSLRDDAEYEGSVGLTYLLAPHFTVGVAYVHDKGFNALKSLPAKYFPAYRDFEHDVSGVSVKYSF